MCRGLIAAVVLLLFCMGCAAENTATVPVPPTQPTVAVFAPATPVPTDTPELPHVWREEPLTAAALSALNLPTEARVWDWVSGDLNGDGQEDMAVVSESTSEDEWNLGPGRTLSILLSTLEGYQLCQQTENYIRRSNEGGVFGDPYSGMQIEDGQLTVGFYGGSSWHWGEYDTFGWKDDGLVLLNERSERSRVTTDPVRVQADIFDYEYGLFERYIDGETLLFRCAMENECRRMEDLLKADEVDLEWQHPAPYLPALNPLEFNEKSEDRTPPAVSAADALERVREELNIPLERMDIPWTEETYQNYSKELGYEPPRCYYTSGERVLYYSSLAYSGEGYEHEVLYRSLDWAECKSYVLKDSIGEIIFD